MVERGRGGQRPLCRSQINSKIARVSQMIDRKAAVWLKDMTVGSFDAIYNL